jgi:hypothetical protein
MAEAGSLASKCEPLSHEENDHLSLSPFETALAAPQPYDRHRLEN